MNELKKKKKSWLKRTLIAAGILLVIGIAIVWYYFTLKFDDTSTQKAEYTIRAIDLLQEFSKDEASANKKYSEKMMVVSGRVTQLEQMDTTYNVKFIDTATGNYIIFAFQQQNINDAKQLKVGDSISIKGSCSAGTHSELLGIQYITFKRCVVNK